MCLEVLPRLSPAGPEMTKHLGKQSHRVGGHMEKSRKLEDAQQLHVLQPINFFLTVWQIFGLFHLLQPHTFGSFAIPMALFGIHRQEKMI